jgi:hypothetical protein
VIQQGDDVYLVADALDVAGVLLTPDTTGRGVVVGWQGPYDAVVQWGHAGDYSYAVVPISDLRKYERRSRQ